jgi:phosphoribosylformylglycinamidine cyclo-ligase
MFAKIYSNIKRKIIMINRKYEVDIDIANQTKLEMTDSLMSKDYRVMNKIGAFASLYNFDFPYYKNPVLVMKTEEPGSKQLLAFKYNRVESICYDMIGHLINDCIVMGARPLIVQDTIVCGKIDKEVINKIVSSISKCCQENDCSLTGGETTEQPGVLQAGNYVLTSSIVGIVEKENIIDGSKIKKDQIIIGVESSGLHTNGYTLIRKLLDENPDLKNKIINGRSFIDLIMEPHKCYYNSLKELFVKNIITGLAHITGGGIKENLNRILPEKLDAQIYLEKYQIFDLYKEIKKIGNISDDEMIRVFNMSIGLAIVAENNNAGIIINHLNKNKIKSYLIGEIKEGSQKVNTKGNFIW